MTLVMLTGVVTRPHAAVGSILASRPMRWLGERSYSIYLWNVLARIAIINALGHSVMGDAAWIATFVVLGEASFRLVERPLRAKLGGNARPHSGGLAPTGHGPLSSRAPRASRPW